MGRRTLVARVLVRVMLLALLVPMAANAVAKETAGTYAGTYVGAATGSGDTGGVSTPVTVVVEDLGDSARFTVTAEEFDISVAAEGLEQPTENGVTVPLSVDTASVKGDGTVAMVETPEGWKMTATGSGEALGETGSGTLDAVRAEGSVPSIGDQVSDMFVRLTGGDPEPAIASPEDATVTTPAPWQAPLTEQGKLGGSALGILALVLLVILL